MVPPLWTMVGLGLGSSEIEVSQGFQSLTATAREEMHDASLTFSTLMNRAHKS